MFCTLAVPGYSDVILSATGNLTGGTVTVNSSNVVTALSDVPYNLLVVEILEGGPPSVSSYPDFSADLNLIDGGTVLELDGVIPSLGINSSIALMDITLAGPLINIGGAPVLDVAIPNTTSITESVTLLNALGITGELTSTLGNNSGLIGQGSNGIYDVTSDTLGVQLAAPEPGTLPLLAVSLFALALILRKKVFQLQ